MRETSTVAAAFIGGVAVTGLLGRVCGCAASAKRPTLRWSSGSDRLYLQDGGCIDLAGMMEERADGPLHHWDKTANQIAESFTGTFFLNSTLHILTDTTLEVVGPAHGGTCAELLLRSDEVKHIQVRAYGGTVMFKGTKVFSWDEKNNNYDLDLEDGRSCVQAISEVVETPPQTCVGKATTDVGEARMDIYDSEMAYLGWDYKESYGVSYKARGLCEDHSNMDIFDRIGVTGDIINSELHHNHFGHYSYGHDGGNWSNNHVHDNVGYGFDPHDDSDSLTIHNNHVHDNGWHGIIASKRCNNVSIVGNHVHDNGENGIMLHRSCDFGEIMDNWVHDNANTGISIHETKFTTVTNNILEDNHYGIRWNVGASYTYCAYNTIKSGEGNGDFTPSYPIYFYKGTDPPEVEGNDGRPKFNYVGYNTLYSVKDDVAKISDCDQNIFAHNHVPTGQYFRFLDAQGNFVMNNTFLETAKTTEGHHLVNDTVPSCFAPGSKAEVDSDLAPYICP